MLRSGLLWLSHRRRFGDFLGGFRLTRRQVQRFIPGETLGDALQVIDGLSRDGMLAAITYLGEYVKTPEEAREAATVYRTAVAEIAKRGLPCVPSLKLTHVGLDIGEALCLENVGSVLAAAKPHGIRVWIDMEDSSYTDRTLAVIRKLRAQHDNVACVLQAYLYRTAKDLEELIPLGVGIRLCKGAYKEPSEIAFPKKSDVDRNYASLLERLLSRETIDAGTYPGLATHDPKLIAHARRTALDRKIPLDRFEFQMLYGIGGPPLHRTARDGGFRLRVLVPYGEEWYGFFMRRLAERPANLLFFLKHAMPGTATASPHGAPATTLKS